MAKLRLSPTERKKLKECISTIAMAIAELNEEEEIRNEESKSRTKH